MMSLKFANLAIPWIRDGPRLKNEALTTLFKAIGFQKIIAFLMI